MNTAPLKTTTSLLSLVIIDQATKAYAKTANTFTTNNQGAFSFPIPQFTTIILSTITILAFIYLVKTRKGSKLQQAAFILLIAGGTSNLLDRLIHQHVIDILSIHTANLNLADTYIVAGVTILAFHLLIIIREQVH